MKMRLAVTLLILSCCAGSQYVFAQSDPAPEVKPAAAAAPVQEWQPSEYKIGNGNILRIDMYNGKGEKLSQVVRVSADGGISLPFVGEINANGLTVTQLQRELKQRLVKNDFVSSNVLVFVEEFSAVTIVGEVNRSGDYPIKGRLTIVELIAMAGGLSEFASTDEIKVIRLNPDGTKTKNVVKLYDAMNTGSMENEGFLLQPDDMVIVPRSVVSIMGEVNRPGIFPTRGRMTIIELIAMAGGRSEFASTDEVKVLRLNADGAKTKIVVKFDDATNSGSTENEGFLLNSYDVIIVPRSEVSIMGEVNKPGIFPIRGRVTTIELIAMAGGFSKFASPNEVKITHTNPDGTKTRSIVRVKDILNKGTGENEDLVLSSGDVVYVPAGIY